MTRAHPSEKAAGGYLDKVKDQLVIQNYCNHVEPGQLRRSVRVMKRAREALEDSLDCLAGVSNDKKQREQCVAGISPAVPSKHPMQLRSSVRAVSVTYVDDVSGCSCGTDVDELSHPQTSQDESINMKFESIDKKDRAVWKEKSIPTNPTIG